MGIKSSKTKLGLWLSTFISMAGLLLIVFVANLIENTITSNFNKTLLTIISVIIAYSAIAMAFNFIVRTDSTLSKSCVLKIILSFGSKGNLFTHYSFGFFRQ